MLDILHFASLDRLKPDASCAQAVLLVTMHNRAVFGQNLGIFY